MANQQRKRPLSEQDAYAAALSMILGHGDRPGRLDLSGLGLSELPAEIGRLTRLSMLNLGDNQLVELPAEIGRLAGLEELYLDGNLLAELPAQIGGLRQLKFLRLARNRLTSLVPEIGQLHNLHELVLDGNRLTALPPEVGQLAELLWLRYAIADQAARLPQMGQRMNSRWLAARDEALSLDAPQIFYHELVAVCRRHGLEDAEIRVVSLALSHVFPVAAAIGDAVERRRHEEMRRSLDLMEKFAQQGPPVQEDPTSPPARLAGGLTRAEGSALRAFREMLFELDPPKAFGGLRRVQDPTGDFIWLCPTHYPQWDPGLPEIPP